MSALPFSLPSFSKIDILSVSFSMCGFYAYRVNIGVLYAQCYVLCAWQNVRTEETWHGQSNFGYLLNFSFTSHR